MTRNPPVRLILDRSALLAYTAGSMHAAEPVGQVVENGGCIGVPVAVAAETLTLVDDLDDRAFLMHLFGDDACAVLDMHGADWHELSYWQTATGRFDLAACMLASFAHEAWILTAEPKLYGDGAPVIEIPEV